MILVSQEPAGFQKSVRAAEMGDWRAWLAGMIVRRVVRLLYLVFLRLLNLLLLLSLVGVQGHRAPGAAPRSRRAAQSQPEAAPEPIRANFCGEFEDAAIPGLEV
jgi:hypothetical protein